MINMNYLNRDLTQELEKWLGRREILAIKGPRQGGKTTILKILQKYLIEEKNIPRANIVYITLEDRDIRDVFSKDPKEYIRSYLSKTPVERIYFLIDEFQYLKEGGQKLKLLYDIFEGVKFIITGSSSLEITEHTAGYLVGRVFSFKLYQFNFSEFLCTKPQNLQNVYRESHARIIDFIENGNDITVKEDIWARDFTRFFEEFVIFGGYPEVIKTEDIDTKRIILKNIYDTYITKDIIELLKIKDISTFRTIVNLLGNQIGNLLNYNSIASDSGSYFRQLKQYISILEETFIIRLIKPYFRNKTTELKKNPKVYFVDTGLRNYTINNFNRMDIRADTGALVENVVLFSLFLKEEWNIRYWRTLGQAEVDFVIEVADALIPIEVKYSHPKHPEISRSLKNFILAYNPERALVFTKGFWGKTKVEKTHVIFVPIWYAI